MKAIVISEVEIDRARNAVFAKMERDLLLSAVNTPGSQENLQAMLTFTTAALDALVLAIKEAP